MVVDFHTMASVVEKVDNNGKRAVKLDLLMALKQDLCPDLRGAFFDAIERMVLINSQIYVYGSSVVSVLIALCINNK